ncbi:MAG: HD domain-containing protein [Saprospiraceae bacterium]|nr:HD domain-containing protein [Saprospiraceae bacterium]
MNYLSAKNFILNELNQLSPSLTYHGKHHTLDVLNVAESLCVAESISYEATVRIMTAALLHDCGFLRNYHEHEKHSCKIAQEVLPQFNYTEGDIKHICEMIMATKIPQMPKDYCAKILCDADLDYLGRNDFYAIGQTLFSEMKIMHLVETEEEWNNIQIRFLERHQFFTKTSLYARTPRKNEHLEGLKKIIEKK